MLKQIKSERMTLFLNLFTQELIQNSKPRTRGIEEYIQEKTIPKTESIPKIPKQKIISKREGQIPKKIQNPIKFNIQPKTFPNIKKPIIYPKLKTEYAPRHPPMNLQIKRPAQINLPSPKPLPKLEPLLLAPKKTIAKIQNTAIQTEPFPAQIKPRVGKVDLGKLNALLHDRGITTIECPGPEKFILIKKTGKINLTKIKLTKEEIEIIIKNFSEKARIPLFGGVFKAVIGDLAISAIFSEITESRFIIYRKTPYSLVL